MTEIISRAAVCDALIGPNGVTLQKQRLAPLMPGQIRVRLKAAALNFPDLLMTYGKYQFRPALPFVLGMEGAGIIEEVTDISGAFRPGDAVLVKNKTGI
ncbi:MAG: alcohol dehydrogenase catalytic domain-containing protein, partial [Sneathiella sp.]|nr:alcohol dehydrogenase catalytic domain-containing protein [Sneathiella sp.]